MCYRSLRKYISFFLRQGLFNKYQEKTREHLEKWSGGWKDVPLLILVHNRLTHPWGKCWKLYNNCPHKEYLLNIDSKGFFKILSE